jgi:hypothetical protein
LRLSGINTGGTPFPRCSRLVLARTPGEGTDFVLELRRTASAPGVCTEGHCLPPVFSFGPGEDARRRESAGRHPPGALLSPGVLGWSWQGRPAKGERRASTPRGTAFPRCSRLVLARTPGEGRAPGVNTGGTPFPRCSRLVLARTPGEGRAPGVNTGGTTFPRCSRLVLARTPGEGRAPGVHTGGTPFPRCARLVLARTPGEGTDFVLELRRTASAPGVCAGRPQNRHCLVTSQQTTPTQTAIFRECLVPC